MNVDVDVGVGGVLVGKKKSEKRKHTALIRVEESVRERAALAASLMRLTLAEYATEALRKASDQDIAREARKLAGGSK